MELQAASGRAQAVRMDDQDRVSQTSSVATISYFPVRKSESDGKVQTFGKRCLAAKRDPNCPVVIRGWLNKKDSSGLKLWKRRWFVLSNYCLFYYKDSREESVLGSIPLPSYKILFCTPRECKSRKFTFKVVHQGMRSYFFSADTQEDMLGWVRALSQSAAMEPNCSLNRRCSSYQDFTQIGGSSESLDFPRTPSDGAGRSQRHKHVNRTLSEPSRLPDERTEEPRGRRGLRQRNSSRTPSPADFSRRRACDPHQEEDLLPPGQITPPPAPTEMMGAGSLTPRGHLGSRPHTPVGRVDIRPCDDAATALPTIYYAPASPNLEFKSTPSTPVTERWPKLCKPTPTYGSVHHTPGGRRHSGKAPNPDPRETPPIRPLESDADVLLTRLCGCDKLLQSLSEELAQLQMDKDSVECALDVSRLQLDEWASRGPRAQEEAVTQKALLQEDLVTIRARMCDVSLEMERVWSQYERMESELAVIRSHLQHICSFGMPQDQSQAQRELWMMEDILTGLKINRDHFRFLLGLQRTHTPAFQPTSPHPASPGSPTGRPQRGFPMEAEQEPPLRPPLPQELQESLLGRGRGPGRTESPYEGIYGHTFDPVQRKGNSQMDFLYMNIGWCRHINKKSGSKWMPPDTMNQSTKKMKMSEEEQIERMKRNRERLTNRKKAPVLALGQSSAPGEEAPFPLRVTRVVTAVLPSSAVARRVSVEDPPPELDNPLPEQMPPETHHSMSGRSASIKQPRGPPPGGRDRTQTRHEEPVVRTKRHQGILRSSKKEKRSEANRAGPTETSRDRVQGDAAEAPGSESSDAIVADDRRATLLTPDMDPDPCLTPEQREAKLRRVERIRERIIRSAVRQRDAALPQLPIRGEGQEAHQVTPDAARKQRMKSDHRSYGSCDHIRGSAELQPSGGIPQNGDERDQVKCGDKTQDKDHSVRTGVARNKTKRPASPYHLSSMTVYQKDGGKGLASCTGVEERKPEGEGDSPSSDLRAKWFLSSNQWQGFAPVQIPGADGRGEEASGDVTDSNEMSSAVSESLEKMRENHSLFYKITCDIAISDTDIATDDGKPNPPCRTDEEELQIIESVDVPPEEREDASGRDRQPGVGDGERARSREAPRSGEESGEDTEEDPGRTREPGNVPG
ncbi:pleckstrin homology domain-containing family A member 4 isoform X6 [Pungitius pungitius]|uniref:pleckstrin homology domain-containing family A member 4 isoform X6 n=1 Tax=Pungitius pungitius TaxID=134920 RepID=UPI002E15714C